MSEDYRPVKEVLTRLIDYALKQTPPIYVSVSEITELLLGCYYRWRLKYIYGIPDPSDPSVEKYMSIGAKVHKFITNKILELQEQGLLGDYVCKHNVFINYQPIDKAQKIDDMVVNLVAKDMLNNTISAIRKFVNNIKGLTPCREVVDRIRILAEIDLMSPSFALIGTPDIVLEDLETRKAAIIELKSSILRILNEVRSNISPKQEQEYFLHIERIYKDVKRRLKSKIYYSYYEPQILLYAILEAERLGLVQPPLKDREKRIFEITELRNMESIINPLYALMMLSLLNNRRGWLYKLIREKLVNKILRHDKELKKLIEITRTTRYLNTQSDDLVEIIINGYFELFKKLQNVFEQYIDELVEKILESKILMLIVDPWRVKKIWPRLQSTKPEKIKARAKFLIYGSIIVILTKTPVDVVLSKHKEIAKILELLSDESLVKYGYENIIANEHQLFHASRETLRNILSTQARIESSKIMKTLRKQYLNYLHELAEKGGISGLFRRSFAKPNYNTDNPGIKCTFCPAIMKSMCKLYGDYTRVAYAVKHSAKISSLYKQDLIIDSLVKCIETSMAFKDSLLSTWSITWVARFNLLRDMVEKYEPYNLLETRFPELNKHIDMIIYEKNSNDKFRVDLFEKLEPIETENEILFKAERDYRLPKQKGSSNKELIDLGTPEPKPIEQGTPVLVVLLNDIGPSPLLKITIPAILDKVKYDVETDKVKAILRPLPYYSRATTQFHTLKTLLRKEPWLREKVLLLHIKTSIARLLLPAVMAYELDQILGILYKCLVRQNITLQHNII